MRRAFRDFDERADGASVAVIYFAGHALAVDGVNYLVPVDARLERDTYVDDEAVPLSQLIAAVDGAKNIRLVMLATTDDDPLTGAMKRSIRKRVVAPGLAAIDPPRSTVVAYAIDDAVAAGGGRNSPYAAALLAHLKTPALGLAAFLDAVRRRCRRRDRQPGGAGRRRFGRSPPCRSCPTRRRSGSCADGQAEPRGRARSPTPSAAPRS